MLTSCSAASASPQPVTMNVVRFVWLLFVIAVIMVAVSCIDMVVFIAHWRFTAFVTAVF